MTSHFTGTTKNRRCSHGKQRLKRCVFRRLRKTGSEGADVTCGGRPFQMRAAATGKARSPTQCSRDKLPFSFCQGTGFDNVRLRLSLATRTQISVCKSPFPSAGTAVSLAGDCMRTANKSAKIRYSTMVREVEK